MFDYGDWINTLEDYSSAFSNGVPYEHCVIENFFDSETFNMLSTNFPKSESVKWDIYDNPIEKKWAFKDFESDSLYSKLVSKLNSTESLEIWKTISSISNLEEDPYMNGAGVHYHQTNTKLDLHLDYSIHPITGKERRLNLIYFLNEEWNQEWNGALELWNDADGKPKECVTRIYPKPNSAVLFKTSDISIHGLPDSIQCPENVGRKTFAIYFVSEPRECVVVRKKAEFFPKPEQVVSPYLQRLYDIRKVRRIEKNDLEYSQ